MTSYNSGGTAPRVSTEHMDGEMVSFTGLDLFMEKWSRETYPLVASGAGSRVVRTLLRREMC